MSTRPSLADAPPKAAARVDSDGHEAEDKIYGDDTNLIEGLGGVSEFRCIDRNAELAPRREVEMQEQQHHHDADALHNVDVRPGPGKVPKIEEDHAVAGCEQQNDAQPYPGEEAGEYVPPQPDGVKTM
jgi:hypothetical protein